MGKAIAVHVTESSPKLAVVKANLFLAKRLLCLKQVDHVSAIGEFLKEYIIAS